MAVDLNIRIFKTPTGYLKIIEIILLIVCLGLVRDYKNGITFGNPTRLDDMYFGWGITVAYLIITPLLLILYVLNQTDIQRSYFEMTVNFLAFASFISLGAVSIDFYKDYPDVSFNNYHRNRRVTGLSLGTFCLLSGITYLIDSFFAFMNQR